MTQPVRWPKKTFFYPIGNTPAVCFTQDLAPEEPADILLLGCGDPRSILYTIFADLGAPDRPLDFTCCDWEPAVLARNVLLYTILADEGFSPQKSTKIWNILYHFYLDIDSLELLLSHCRKLLERSTSIEVWNASEYGSYLKFVTSHSLVEIRRHWNLYAETGNLSTEEKNCLQASFSDGLKSVLNRYHDSSVLSSGRSAGPFWMDLATLGAQQFRQFWATGVTSGTTTTSSKKSATHVNPTFAFSRSGRGFNVHYGTDPILGFHLALALAPLKTARNKVPVGIDGLVKSAKSQFHTWCTAFRKRIIGPGQPSAPLIMVRMFLGDAVAFPRVLSYCAQSHSTSSGLYSSSWGGTQIDLDILQYGQGSGRRAPLQFDVIDTSNLTDHVGLINILTSTVPLLRKRPSSVLHTSALLPSGGKGAALSGFVERACSDIMTLSLILGVTPTAYFSGFNSHTNIHDMFSMGVTPTQFHESISWRMPPSTWELDDRNCRLKIDCGQLGKFVFGVYLKMFADENIAAKFSMLNNFGELSDIHYIRASFVLFLQLVKRRVQTDWDKCMDLFLSLVERDHTLLMGSNNYQDLCCSLHIYGVYTVITMSSDFAHSRALKTSGPLQKWEHVPPVVCMVIEVPRESLKVLEDMDPDTIQTPILHCETRVTHSQNIHSSIQMMFGTVDATGLHELRKVTVIEDPRGWSGNSPLIVSFLIPSWILTIDPSQTEVGLFIRTTPASTLSLHSKLGLFLKIFSVPIMDEHIHVVRERPHNKDELQILSITSSVSLDACTCSLMTTAILDNSAQATSLVVRADITDAAGQDALSTKAEITTAQVSRCRVDATIGTFRQELHYPFSVDGTRSKLRIARKSSYVELEVPVMSSGLPFTLQPFPVSFHAQRPNIWNLHYVNLDVLPSVDVTNISRLHWLHVHLGLTLSDRERQAKDAKDQLDRGTLVNMKESICTVFIAYAGMQNLKRTRIFGLSDPENGGMNILIFANDMRLDLASHTVVADACVLPLTKSIVAKVRPSLDKLHTSGLLQINTLKDESVAWKHLLPVLVERCRKWQHLDSCEYLSGGFPLSVEHSQSPICGCGRGKDIGTFKETHNQWKELAPLVTRIALSPLFAVSFLESIGSFLRDDFKEEESEYKGTGKQDNKCARCGGSGKPQLLVCSRCKETSYCSQICQKEDWKAHKARCKK